MLKVSPHWISGEFGSWAPTIEEKLDKDRPVVVLCKVGMRSMQLCNWLNDEANGYREIYNVDGGISEYSARVDPGVGPQY